MSWFRMAIHEAGHAIVALSFRRKIVEVWAEKDIGLCQTHPVEWEGSIALARTEVSIAVAGNIAEGLHFGNTYSTGLHVGQIAIAHLFAHPESDEARAAKVAQWLAKAQTSDQINAVAEIRRAETTARRILRRHWCQVLALARSIRQRKGRPLAGQELSKLLRIQRKKENLPNCG